MTDRLAELRRDYGDREIDPATLLEDPIDQFRAWFREAEEAEIYEPNGMVLSTCSPNGIPSSRVVLLKQLSADGFVFFTDYGSHKGREILANPHVALVFWWDRIHRQVRVTGIAEQVAAELSDHYFQSRPLGSRISAIASHQSQVVASRAELETAAEEVRAGVGPSESPARPERWGGFLVRPRTVEFWQGRSNRLHDRVLYTRQPTGWARVRLSP